MSDEKSLPKIKNNTESNEPPLEYNPNIPMDTIKFRRRISRLNTSMRQIIKRIESRIPKNIGSIFDGKNVKVKSVKLIGLTDKFLNKDVEEKKKELELSDIKNKLRKYMNDKDIISNSMSTNGVNVNMKINQTLNNINYATPSKEVLISFENLIKNSNTVLLNVNHLKEYKNKKKN